MEDFEVNLVARKSVKGVFALVSRTFFLQVLTIISSFILTVFLAPEHYGVFFVVTSIIVFLTYFQDIGLAAALIQKKETLTIDELRSTFTVQQLLVLLIIIPVFLFSENIAKFYGLDSEGHYLLLALLFSFLLSSLRTIPTVILERNLEFKKLVIPQIAENLVYNILLIILAIQGFGVSTFTFAVIAKSIVGIIAVYIIQSWPIGVSFKFTHVKNLINFGIPFQANTLLALFKDELLIVYIGKILPLAQVGYIGFAQRWAFMPLRLVMDNVIKITFPSMSRLQHDKGALRIAIEKSLFLISFVIFPVAVAIIQYSSYLISFIPRYEKWEPAILSLTFFALNTVFSSISTPLTNFLIAIGKVKITLVFMVFWTITTWIVTPIAIMQYGFNGFAGASFVISTTSIIVFIVAKRFVEFSLLKPVFRQLAASIIMFIVIEFSKFFIVSFPTLILNMLIAGTIYIGILFWLSGPELVKTARFIIISVRSK